MRLSCTNSLVSSPTTRFQEVERGTTYSTSKSGDRTTTRCCQCPWVCWAGASAALRPPLPLESSMLMLAIARLGIILLLQLLIRGVHFTCIMPWYGAGHLPDLMLHCVTQPGLRAWGQVGAQRRVAAPAAAPACPRSLRPGWVTQPSACCATSHAQQQHLCLHTSLAALSHPWTLTLRL